MSEESGGESEIRKRAAWLLVMLALVAILFATLMLTVLGGNTGHHAHTALGDDPIRSLSAGPPPTPTTNTDTTPKPHPSAEHGSAEGSSGGGAPSVGVSSTPAGPAPHTCPTPAPCALDSDVGNAIAAVNSYRVQHGQDPVPGAVSAAAQTCAASNGETCSGEWALTYVPEADGQAAVDKVVARAHNVLTMTSFEIGWAYDPAGQQYYFAIVQDG